MKQQQREQKRQFWVLVALVFLGFIGISMPYLIFPPLFLNPGYSFFTVEGSDILRALFLGITLAAYPLGQFIGSPILGALSDDYGRKPLLIGSLIVSGICNLLTGLSIAWLNIWLLIGSRFLAGLMEGNIAIGRAMAAEIKTIPKHETLGKINASTAIAYLIGPILGGILSDKSLFEGLTPSSPFYFISVLFLALAALTAWVLKKTEILSRNQTLTVWQRIHFLKRMSTLFKNRPLKLLMIASTCFTLAVDIFYEFGPVYLTVKWTLIPSQLIFYNCALCIGLVLGNGWLPSFISPRISSLLLIPGAMGGFALLLTGTLFVDSSFWMMALFGLIGLSIGLAVTLITVKISDSVSDTIQGEVMGTQLSLRVLGDGLICLLGGVLLILSSKIILAGAAVLSCAALLYFRLKK